MTALRQRFVAKITQRYRVGARVSKHAVAEYADLGRSSRFGGRGRRRGHGGLDPSGTSLAECRWDSGCGQRTAEFKPPRVVPPAPLAIPATPPAANASSSGEKPSSLKPTFDVVTVDPSGEAVIAGRAAPNAKVELRDAGKAVGEATADAAGQFVIIPPALAPGDHSLQLAAGDSKGAVRDVQYGRRLGCRQEAKAPPPRQRTLSPRRPRRRRRPSRFPCSPPGPSWRFKRSRPTRPAASSPKARPNRTPPCVFISTRPTSPTPRRKRTAAGR